MAQIDHATKASEYPLSSEASRLNPTLSVFLLGILLVCLLAILLPKKSQKLTILTRYNRFQVFP